MRPRQAKARLRKTEINVAEPWKPLIGAAIKRAVDSLGWSLKEFAAKVRRDERQCKRWFEGVERAQFDALFAVPELQQALVIEIAKLAEHGVEVVTEIRVRRTA